jgi:hypothetical protein
VTVITGTTILSSVDDASSVATVGEGVVTKMVVGMIGTIVKRKDDTDDRCERLCDEDSVDGLVLPELEVRKTNSWRRVSRLGRPR